MRYPLRHYINAARKANIEAYAIKIYRHLGAYCMDLQREP